MPERCTAWICALAYRLGENSGAHAYEWGQTYDVLRPGLEGTAQQLMATLLPTAPTSLAEAATAAYVAGWDAGALRDHA